MARAHTEPGCLGSLLALLLLLLVLPLLLLRLLVLVVVVETPSQSSVHLLDGCSDMSHLGGQKPNQQKIKQAAGWILFQSGQQCELSLIPLCSVFVVLLLSLFA